MKLQAVRKFNPIFNGMNEQELKDFFMICSQEVQGLFNKSVLKEVQKARDEGFHTVLLSGTYHEFLQNIGDQLEFDTVIGSQMYFNHGKYDSKKETEIVIGDLKLKKIIERFGYEEVDWEASRAYADGYSDLKLLQAVGQPIVVNPDAKLKAVAIDKKWMILF